MEKKKGISTGAKLGIGAGVAAVAAGGVAASYLFAGKHAKAHRAKAKKLFQTARKEVVKQAKKLPKITKEEFDQVVGQVVKEIAAFKKERPEELVHVANELKASWGGIEREIKRSTPKVKAAAKKVGKAAKKLVTKKKSSTKKKRQ